MASEHGMYPGYKIRASRGGEIYCPSPGHGPRECVLLTGGLTLGSDFTSDPNVPMAAEEASCASCIIAAAAAAAATCPEYAPFAQPFMCA
ncbi:hypothetical protein EYF80_055424 [Liparis tanakae]|uniref:Uncharacterized protein n=1 Tax=Liparis tanakae TaxID=230148 RepID=A0A4Z2F065_9TELE|nr:hypothetical protein EYF80_055424 [Liparis tanakae]